MNPDLLDRLLGLLTVEQAALVLPIDSMIAALRERQRGQLTRAQIKAALALSDADDTALNTVYTTAALGVVYNFDTVHDLLRMGATRNRQSQSGAPYYTKAQIKTRLGI